MVLPLLQEGLEERIDDWPVQAEVANLAHLGSEGRGGEGAVGRQSTRASCHRKPCFIALWLLCLLEFKIALGIKWEFVGKFRKNGV